jgi:hypothetical protein
MCATSSQVTWLHAHSLALTNIPPLDIYGRVLSQSKATMVLFKVLKVKIGREVEFQKRAFQMLGAINTLLTAASSRQNYHINN